MLSNSSKLYNSFIFCELYEHRTSILMKMNPTRNWLVWNPSLFGFVKLKVIFNSTGFNFCSSSSLWRREERTSTTIMIIHLLVKLCNETKIYIFSSFFHPQIIMLCMMRGKFFDIVPTATLRTEQVFCTVNFSYMENKTEWKVCILLASSPWFGLAYSIFSLEMVWRSFL